MSVGGIRLVYFRTPPIAARTQNVGLREALAGSVVDVTCTARWTFVLNVIMMKYDANVKMIVLCFLNIDCVLFQFVSRGPMTHFRRISYVYDGSTKPLLIVEQCASR